MDNRYNPKKMPPPGKGNSPIIKEDSPFTWGKLSMLLLLIIALVCILKRQEIYDFGKGLLQKARIVKAEKSTYAVIDAESAKEADSKIEYVVAVVPDASASMKTEVKTMEEIDAMKEVIAEVEAFENWKEAVKIQRIQAECEQEIMLNEFFRDKKEFTLPSGTKITLSHYKLLRSEDEFNYNFDAVRGQMAVFFRWVFSENWKKIDNQEMVAWEKSFWKEFEGKTGYKKSFIGVNTGFAGDKIIECAQYFRK